MSFEAGIRKHIVNANGNADALVKKIAFEAFSRVIMKTPVDTGRARANWQADINIIPSGTAEDTDKGKKGNSAADGSGRSKAKAKMQGVVSRAVAGDSVILANNLPYIQKLENGAPFKGASRQAPGGMVKITLIEIDNILKSASK